MANRLRVFVIDDDPGIRDYLSVLVSRAGHDVSVIATGEEALERIEADPPELVLLDVVLPGRLSGLETLAQIHEKRPDAAVIMLSGHGQARTIVEAMRLGAADFLRKPFEVEEIELAIQKVCEQRVLKQEVEELRGRVRTEAEAFTLFGDNPKMRVVREIVEQVADTDITVLIRGESGTGKEIVARALHQLSSRRDKPFVKVNCAALPSELLESELFGFERGAFTGAQNRKLGKFEYANHGTIFLDEISEMHPNLQAKLLQVLQDGEFSRLGGETDVRVDVRVLAATHRNLAAEVRDGRFREDLFYRLNVVAVALPPLRERRDAIALFVDHFLRKYSAEYRKEVLALRPETLELFSQAPWPGNVRELENLVKRLVVLGCESEVISEFTKSISEVQGQKTKKDEEGLYFEGLTTDLFNHCDVDLKMIAKRAAQIAEKRVIERVLGKTRWNRKEAAERLQISYKALLYKMKENGLGESVESSNGLRREVVERAKLRR